jgi:glycosyltransferase involved in cell wall biosynthesis
MACAVIAGNNFLAEEASKYCKNVFVIPTAVDTHRWKPIGREKVDAMAKGDEFRIGWSGSSSSFKFFIPLQREIKQFLYDFPSSRLVMMSDKFPNELNELKPHIEFVNWRPDDEVSFVQSLDVGLMPIKDDLWSKGKCAYKMLLYAACGIPSIATPIGVNKSILAETEVGFGPSLVGEWYESLQLLFDDRQMGKRLGENGVRLVNDRYSVDICTPKIVEIFRRFV